MATLSPNHKHLLLTYPELRAFVENDEKREFYAQTIQMWRTRNEDDDERFLDNDYIADKVIGGFLEYFEYELIETMRQISAANGDFVPGDFYLYIGQYFVDLTDGHIQ